MQKLSIKLTLYAACGGAFSLFMRWMQDQIAFDELGLPTGGFWNVALIALILAAVIVYLRFSDDLKQKHYHGDKNFCAALKNEGKLYKLLRIFLGVLMCAGGLILIVTTRVEKEEKFLLVLGLTAVASGISFPLLLSSANKGEERSVGRGFFALAPVVMCAVWLVTVYKINDISSIVWGFGVQIICIGTAMFSFFRVSGYVFDTPDPFRSIFSCMFGTFMCMLACADDNFLGMKIMLFACAGMLLYYNWVLVMNLHEGKTPERKPVNDGFERL